jgi:hypothetical protein
MRPLQVVAALTFSVSAFSAAYANEFVPGEIFISVHGPEGCLAQADWIWRVDPSTRVVSEFAAVEDGLCDSNGLRFTPDGRFLRVLNLSSATVLDLDSAGAGQVVLGPENGLGGPYGFNGLDWDAQGNFYVADYSPGRVMRFRPRGALPEQSWFTPYYRGGALICTPGGEVFYSYGDVYRVTSTGIELFDQLRPEAFAYGLAVTRSGHLLVATRDAILRYANAQADRRSTVLPGLASLGAVAIALAGDDRTLFRANYGYGSTPSALLAIDIETGTYEEVYRLPAFRYAGLGIAVYIPAIRGDMNCSRRLDNFDIDPFVVALTDPAAYAANFSWCDRNLADINDDGAVDNFDIDPFVLALVNQPMP